MPRCESSLPLCAAHHAAEARRGVQVTLILGVAKFLPIIAAWGLARTAGVPLFGAVSGAVVTAGLLGLVERVSLARLHPPARVEAVHAATISLSLAAEGRPDLSPGGPASRLAPALVDRSSPRAAVTALVAAAAALVAGWQWSQCHPSLWLHNPSDEPTEVRIDEGAYPLEPHTSLELRLLIGRHQASVRSSSQRLELPLEVQPGVSLLLATAPDCFAIGLHDGGELEARGQLFSLETGGWRHAPCD